MTLSINTNVASIVARNNLSTSQMSLQTAMQRLSSGLRINSAADDAAGYAISQRMTSQIGGLDQAARNANDGISLAQTAQGALSQITQNLQTVRNLAVQAANGTNSASDRAALNNQASQLIAENNRIAASANFNGVNLLDGSFAGQTFQVGANGTSNDQITISSISSALSSALGVGSNSAYSTTSTQANAVTTAALTAGELTINGYQVGASTSDGVSNTDATGSGIAKAAAINAITGETGVTATVGSTSVTGTAAVNSATTAGGITINGVSIAGVAAGTSAVDQGAAFAAAINAVSSQTGVTAAADTAGKLTLTAADGRNITVGGTQVADAGLTAGTTTSKITLSSTSSAGITLADGGGAGTAAIGGSVGLTAATVTVGAGVSSIDLTTASGASSALATIDAALQSVNTSAAALGAYQNRFQSAVSSLQTYSQNLQTSRSRIQDTDFAAETANMTRAQVLQQAGTAILAQANSAPNGILALLR